MNKSSLQISFTGRDRTGNKYTTTVSSNKMQNRTGAKKNSSLSPVSNINSQGKKGKVSKSQVKLNASRNVNQKMIKISSTKDFSNTFRESPYTKRNESSQKFH